MNNLDTRLFNLLCHFMYKDKSKKSGIIMLQKIGDNYKKVKHIECIIIENKDSKN